MVLVELIRLVIVCSLTAAGYRIGQGMPGPVEAGRAAETLPLIGAIVGAGIGYVAGGILGRALLRGIGSVERRVDRVGGAELISGVLGLLAGALAAAVVSWLVVVFIPYPLLRYTLVALAFIVLSYAGLRVAVRKRSDILQMMGLSTARSFRALPAPGGGPRILDTSAVIDGRIVDLTKAGFLAGRLVCPAFVLGELRGIADSGDPVRRARGRRGLEMLDALRMDPGVSLEVTDDAVPEAADVDAKLIVLARRIGGVLVTTDYNLHRSAELQGVAVLNLNNLAAALRPAVLPGERLRVALVKAGNHPGQGVGYLDDGTMVVVEGGREHIGREVEATITSVMQTSVGRMIFSTATGAGAEAASGAATPEKPARDHGRRPDGPPAR